MYENQIETFNQEYGSEGWTYGIVKIKDREYFVAIKSPDKKAYKEFKNKTTEFVAAKQGNGNCKWTLYDIEEDLVLSCLLTDKNEFREITKMKPGIVSKFATEASNLGDGDVVFLGQ